jgi:hypothetical protein
VSRGGIPRSTREQLERSFESRQQRPRGEHFGPRRRQLDRQGDAIQPTANRCQRGQVFDVVGFAEADARHRNFQREARFADATRAAQRQQPHVAAREVLVQKCQFVSSSDQWTRRGRQCRAVCVDQVCAHSTPRGSSRAAV